MRAATLLATLPLAALAAPSKRAPLLTPRGADLIEGKYIVMMKPGASSKVVSAGISAIAADADHVFSRLSGFTASLTTEEVEALRNNPNVRVVSYSTVHEHMLK